jgi:hypothetical protein
MRVVIGAARRVLRWLALRGSPPGSLCRPDIIASDMVAPAPYGKKQNGRPMDGREVHPAERRGE